MASSVFVVFFRVFVGNPVADQYPLLKPPPLHQSLRRGVSNLLPATETVLETARRSSATSD